MKKLLALVAVVFASVALAGEFPEISINELKDAIASKKAYVIDVNGTQSWQKGHIPSAIDFASIQDRLAQTLPKDKKALIVAYCGGPKCNAYTQAAQAAKKLGYTNVKHLSAGISGWMQAGEKTDKGT